MFLALLDRQFESRGALIATALDSGHGDTAAIAAAIEQVNPGFDTRSDRVPDRADRSTGCARSEIPNCANALVARRRAAADQALRIVEQAGTSPPGHQLSALAQLVVTIISGIATEEVLQPGTVDVDTLTRLFTALLESSPAPGR